MGARRSEQAHASSARARPISVPASFAAAQLQRLHPLGPPASEHRRCTRGPRPPLLRGSRDSPLPAAAHRPQGTGRSLHAARGEAMGAPSAAARPPPAAAARGPPPPAHRRLVAALQSERAAWAAQNALGALFAAVFCVVLDLQFMLACLCGVLYSASSLVLSIDRSIGGRLFGAAVFVGTVIGGASLGEPPGPASACLKHTETQALHGTQFWRLLSSPSPSLPPLPVQQAAASCLWPGWPGATAKRWWNTSRPPTGRRCPAWPTSSGSRTRRRGWRRCPCRRWCKMRWVARQGGSGELCSDPQPDACAAGSDSNVQTPPALPRPACMQLDAAVAFLSRELAALLPPVSPNYWGALMGLSAAAFLPFAAARATRDFGKGIIVAIAFVFLSSMLVFGTVVPVLGEHLFWTEASIRGHLGGCSVWRAGTAMQPAVVTSALLPARPPNRLLSCTGRHRLLQSCACGRRRQRRGWHAAVRAVGPRRRAPQLRRHPAGPGRPHVQARGWPACACACSVGGCQDCRRLLGQLQLPTPSPSPPVQAGERGCCRRRRRHAGRISSHPGGI